MEMEKWVPQKCPWQGETVQATFGQAPHRSENQTVQAANQYFLITFSNQIEIQKAKTISYQQHNINTNSNSNSKQNFCVKWHCDAKSVSLRTTTSSKSNGGTEITSKITRAIRYQLGEDC